MYDDTASDLATPSRPRARVGDMGLWCGDRNHDPLTTDYHECEVVEMNGVWESLDIGIDHNDGRQCPIPYLGQGQVTFSHDLTARRLYVGGVNDENILLIRAPNSGEYIITQAYDPWECPSGTDNDDVCTCEQSVQFTPHAVWPNNYNYAVSTAATGSTSAFMKYKVVFSNAY